jgi:hypothetical protein
MRSVLPDLSELAAMAAYAPHLAQAFASLACDLALVLGRDGVVNQVALSPNSQLALFTAGWVGRPLVDTVTPNTRHKVVSLLQEVADTGLARRREVNLPPLVAGQGADIPLAFTALRLGPEGPILAAGHDLRAVALMQQRFIRVQQELERGYGQTMNASAQDPSHRATAQAPQFSSGDQVGPVDPSFSGQAEQLNEASRVAFAAWLLAERLAAEGPVAKPAPSSRVPGRRRR